MLSFDDMKLSFDDLKVKLQNRKKGRRKAIKKLDASRVLNENKLLYSSYLFTF